MRITDCTSKKLCLCPAETIVLLKKLLVEKPFSVNNRDGLLSFINKVVTVSEEEIVDVRNLMYPCYHVHIVGWEQGRPISARRVRTSYLRSARKNVISRLGA